jgi:molecular chaperone HtpG
VSTETFEFKSEAQQLLNLMIHSLYSTKDIFLRELVSNASDALDKRRFESLTRPELQADGDLKIQVRSWTEGEEETAQRYLEIKDNGIGMSKDELIKNLGTIAHSGTKAFLQEVEKNKADGASQEEVANLIGQFGVGFYSSFIVANHVQVYSCKAGSTESWMWASQGDGQFEISSTDNTESGTRIVLELKTSNTEDGLDDFTAEWTLRQTIKQYSDFVQYPIELWVSKSKEVPVESDADADADVDADADENDETTLKTETVQYDEWEQVNSMQAIWTRDPNEVADSEYNDFYKHVSRNFDEPAERIRFKMDGTFDLTALLFIPSKAPFNLNYRDQKHGLQLYANRVMIMEKCEEILPTWLRFVQGVVESPDLSLNVSREILQQDRRVKTIRKRVVKKTLSHLEDLLGDRRDDYVSFWEAFGSVLKESVGDQDHTDKVKSLFLFKSSTQDGYTTLSEYAERMDDNQDKIYYIIGESVDAIERSPHLEAFNDKEVEVLYLTDQLVDEWMMGSFNRFEEYDLCSVGQGEVELGSEEERKEAEEELKSVQEEAGDLLSALQKTLDEHLKEVRLSQRLTSSPACLVVESGGMSPQLERMLAMQMGGEMAMPKQKRILELNPKHELFTKLKSLFEQGENYEAIDHYAHLIYGQALIAEGTPLTEPVKFSQALTQVLSK